jgi:hypothetical protein
MSSVNFPSGQWVGFYTYPNRSERYLMDLVLQFRDGANSLALQGTSLSVLRDAG